MSNMMGKISGMDWSKAPEGSTHVGDWGEVFYKYDNRWLCWTSEDPKWTKSKMFAGDVNCIVDEEGDKLISKQEDLNINKQYKSVEELPVGMFVKYDGRSGYSIYVTLEHGKSCQFQSAHVINNESFSNDLESFSYSTTYDGEYTPFIVESETDKMIKELEATVAKAQQQIQKLKGVK